MTFVHRLSGVILLFVLLSSCQSPDQPLPARAPAPDLPEVLPQVAPVHTEAAAPDFSVPSLTGDSLRLSDFRGKTLLINFWATWCGPCIAEIPDLIALQKELGTDNFAVIGLSMDLIEKEIVQEFVESMEINYPIGIDEGPVAEAFGGVYSLPTTYVIDKKGMIRQRTIGIFPSEAFKPHLISMIESD